jgi:hypothetical protein
VALERLPPDRKSEMSHRFTDPSKQKTAYHEAGHAVIGWLFGHKILSIRLLKEGRKRGIVTGGVCTTKGHTEWHRTHVIEARRTRPDIEAAIEIVCLIAGMLAESKIELASEDEWLIQSDLTEIGELLDEAEIPRKLPPLIRICQRHTDDHWSQIDGLARALLADGKIVKAKDIRRILGPRTMPLRKAIFEPVGAMNAVRDGVAA